MENLNNVPSSGTYGGAINEVNHNFSLVKGAIDGLEGRTIRSKGLFPTVAALNAAYPSPIVGDYAYVGSGLPAEIYDCVTAGTWHDTGQTGGSETINLGDYSTTTQMNAAIDSGLQGQVGYAVCSTAGATKRKDVIVSGFKLLANGGALHIKMTTANTNASATMNISPTSTVIAANTKPLFYNGEQATAENTWDANEIISVFYDGTRFMASNSQGGGGKAEKISYDNSQSGLVAKNVQGALNELNNSIKLNLSVLPPYGKNLQNNATSWRAASNYKCLFVPRTMLGDTVTLKPITFYISYAFLKYNNSAKSGAAVKFAGSMTKAEKIEVGDAVTLNVPDDCGCLYLYISSYDLSLIDTLFKVYTKYNQGVIYDPIWENKDVLKLSIEACTYNANNGIFQKSSTSNPTRALSDPIPLEDGEWLKVTLASGLKGFIMDLSLGYPAYYNASESIVQTGTFITKGKGSKVIWLAYEDDSVITNVNSLLDGVTIEKGYNAIETHETYKVGQPADAVKSNLNVYSWSVSLNDFYGGRGGSASKNRVASYWKQWIDNDIVVSFKQGVKFLCYDFGTGKYCGRLYDVTDDYTKKYIIRGGRYAILWFAYANDAAIGAAGLSTFLENITIEYISADENTAEINSDRRLYGIVETNNDAISNIAAAKKHLDIVSTGWTQDTNDKLFTIAHLSDIHADLIRYRRFAEFVNKVDEVDAAICTGDFVVDGVDAQYSIMRGVRFDKPYLKVVGNHERLNNNSATLSYVYNNLEMDTNTGKLYYYQDFSNWGIRIIVLNQYDIDAGASAKNSQTEHFTQEQIDWFITTLKDAASNNLAVLVAMHTTNMNITPTSNDKKFYQRRYGWEFTSTSVCSGTIIEDIIDAFKHGTSVSGTYTFSDVQLSITVDTSFDTEGTFIAYMVGHKHADLIGYSTTHSDQLYLVMTVSSLLSAEYHPDDYADVTDLPRIENTKSQDCFNVYGFDLVNKLVKVVRVGSCVNDLMEDRDKDYYTF